MVTNYYNSSNNFSSPIRSEPEPHTECSCNTPSIPEHQENSNDTLIILGLLFCLYMTGCRDKLLLLALIILWISYTSLAKAR